MEDINRNIRIKEKVPLFEIRDSLFTIAVRDSPSAKSVYSLLISLHIIYAAYVHVLWNNYPDVYEADTRLIQSVAASTIVCLLLESILVATVTACTLLVFRYSCYPALIVQSIVIVCSPIATIHYSGIPVLVSGFVMMEQIRFIFKSVSIIVELYGSGEEPTMRSIVYFLFAPTLVYQSEYPRSKSRNWYKVFIWSIETTAMAVTFMLLVSQQLVPAFRDVGKAEVTMDQWLHQLRASLVIGTYQMLVVGYVMLHIQQNWYAEILSFGDRKFYTDWMSSRHPIDFARRWNLIVYVWSVRYVYSPVLRKTGSKIFSLLLVFLISFMAHDYVLNMAGNIFFPFFTMSIFQVAIATPVIIFLAKLLEHYPQVSSLLSRSNFPFLTMQLLASAFAVYSYSNHYYQTHNRSLGE